MIYTRKYGVDDAGLILGAGLIVAVPFTILTGKLLEKGKYAPVLCFSVAANIAGLVLLLIPNLIGLVAGVILVGGGYMCLYQALLVWTKNLFPEDQRAQFEGIKLVFFVLIPMVIGPNIGSAIIKSFGEPVENEYHVWGFTPTYHIFIAAAALALLTYIPVYFAWREAKGKADKKEQFLL